MLQRFRGRVGTAGLIVAIVALVAALGGGAYAASGGLSGKQKKEVTKIAQKEAKKFAGKDGAAGAEGKQGPAGPTGPGGAKGDTGAKGDPGAAGPAGAPGPAGTPGPAGESVEAFPTAGEPGEPCEGTGGTVYEVGGEATEVCSGQEGSPWTAGGTLPKGATETGAWSWNGSATDTEGIYAAISFTLPLPGNLAAENVIFVTNETPSPECPGTSGNPKANEGKLCIYLAGFAPEGANAPVFAGTTRLNGFSTGANASGSLLHFTNIVDGARASGSWALTGS